MLKLKDINECNIDELYTKRRNNKIMIIAGMGCGFIYMLLGVMIYFSSYLVVIPLMFFIMGSSFIVIVNRNYAIDLMIYMKQRDKEIITAPKEVEAEVELKVPSLFVKESEFIKPQVQVSGSGIKRFIGTRTQTVNQEIDKVIGITPEEKKKQERDKILEDILNKSIGELK